MFGKRITLFRLFGFAVRVDASWFVIVALITWTLSSGVFRYSYPGLSAGDYWAMGIFGALALFASVVVHELFHSLVARRYGLPMKGITLFVFGGVAEMESEPPSAKAEFMMAIAGPVASILIGFVFFIFYQVAEPLWPVQVVGVLGYLFWINWILAAFNLIPAFPLDGGRVLRSALWYWKGDLPRATQIAAGIGSGFGILLIGFGIFRLFMGDFIGAIWWFLIGMFIRSTSQASYQQVLMKTALEGESIQRFMITDPITVPPSLPVADLVEDYIYKHHHKMYPVVADSNSHLLGCVTTKDVKNIPREEWARHTVQEITHPCTAENTTAPEEDAQQALARMTRTGVSRLMVVKENHLVGIIALKDLLGFLSTKLEIEGHGSLDL